MSALIETFSLSNGDQIPKIGFGGKDCREENRQIWKAMEEFLASGRVKAIGVTTSRPRTSTASCRRARPSPW